MKIEHFERNSHDEIVAIEGSEKLILPFPFVATFKPMVGDYVFQENGELYFGKQGAEDVAVKEVPEVTEVVTEVTEESPVVI